MDIDAMDIDAEATADQGPAEQVERAGSRFLQIGPNLAYSL